MTVGSMDEQQLEAKIAQRGREGTLYAQLKSLRVRYAKLRQDRYTRASRGEFRDITSTICCPGKMDASTLREPL